MLETPSIIRFRSDEISLKAARDIIQRVTKAPNNGVIRDTIKSLLLIESSGLPFDKQFLVDVLHDAKAIRSAGLISLKSIRTNGKITIETDFLLPAGTVSKGTGSARVKAIQVSKPYILKNSKIENWETIMEVAPYDRLQDFLNGKKVAFQQIKFHDGIVTTEQIESITL